LPDGTRVGPNFSPDGTRIVGGSNDGTLKVWDARTGAPLFDLKGHRGQVFGLRFSPDGARIVTGSGGQPAQRSDQPYEPGEVKVWDARTGTLLLDLKVHTRHVKSVGFSPDGARIVTGSFDNTAKV